MITNFQKALLSVFQRISSQTIRVAAVLLTVVALLTSTFNVFAVPTPGGSHPVAVGPISAETGFPTWYKDSTGTRMELCLDGGLNPLCGYLPGEIPNPDAPITVPDNFPTTGESFYMLSNALMNTDAAGGKAIIVLALEAAFATPEITAGDQVTFGRVRIWIDNLIPSATYKVTHPYGYDLLTADAGGGRRSIRWVEDIGIGAKGDFTGALSSRIGPFLKWDPAVAPAAPTGYIGDPNVLHTVIGSPFNTNFFRVEGPAGSFTGSTNLCADPALGNDPVALDDCIQINQFSLVGKYATNAGVNITQATYSQSTADGGKLDVFASSDANQSIQIARGNGYGTTLLGADGLGHYFARIDFAGVAPAQVQVVNASDVPVASKTIPVVDKVTVKKAEFNAELGTLTVEAVSSDTFNAPVLTVGDYGPMDVNGSLVVNGVGIVPEKITVTSSRGGSDSEAVEVTGNISYQPMPITAGITVPGGDVIPPVAPDTTLAFNVQQNHVITLDGTSSSGDIDGYSWVQLSGSPVVINGANSATATFTSPAFVDTMEFQLTVTRNNPGSTDSKNVTIHTLDVQPPLANAGPDQAGVFVGSKITLDGSASQQVGTYVWTQVLNAGNPVVTLTGANTAKPTFTFPNYAGPLTFQLTVNNAGGSSTDTVLVSATLDVLTQIRADFIRSKNTWRITGVASILGIPVGPGNEVRAYLGVFATEAQAIAANKLIGVSQVDATGAWAIRPANVAANIRAVAGNQITLFTIRGGYATSPVAIK